MPKGYTKEDLKAANDFIGILDNVAAEKRGILRIMMECMLLGASMAQAEPENGGKESRQ